MSYLIYNDYKKLIQADNLLQIINSDISILNQIQNAAVTEAISYLVQKYETRWEFTDTSLYDPAIAYKAGSRVYIDAPSYSATSTYVLGQLTLQGGLIYVSAVAIPTPEAFTQNKWILLGSQFDIFYVGYPYPIFDYRNIYTIGSKVFWKDKVYTALQASIVAGHEVALEGVYYENIPLSNVFPDDAVSGLQYWGVGIAYSVDAGTLYSNPINNYTPAYVQTLQLQYTAVAEGENAFNFAELVGNFLIQVEKEIKPLLTSQFSFDNGTGDFDLVNNNLSLGQSLFILYSNLVILDPVLLIPKWIKGDNRNPQLVNYLIDIVLYHVHSRIAPMNIPELRIKRYDDVISWLKDAAQGKYITADLPAIQPRAGGRIRYGGDVKRINSY